MNHSPKIVLAAALAAFALAGGFVPGGAVHGDVSPFTVVVLPDTQDSIARYPQILKSQVRWIRDNAVARNIAFVIHVGDITDTGSPVEWQRASGILAGLDGAVPCALALGNHDLDPRRPRDTVLFNRFFPVPSGSTDAGWCGTFTPGRRENACQLFAAGGVRYLVLTIEFGPRDEVLAWANETVRRYPEHRVIVNTHAFTYTENRRQSRRDHWNPHDYAWLAAVGSVNDGEEMWRKFAGLHRNIFMVVNGHVKGDGAGKLASVGPGGATVFQLLANYQSGVTATSDGQTGFMRIMTFYPARGVIEVRTYSPYRDQWLRGFNHEFDIDLARGIFRPVARFDTLRSPATENVVRIQAAPRVPRGRIEGCAAGNVP